MKHRCNVCCYETSRIWSYNDHISRSNACEKRLKRTSHKAEKKTIDVVEQNVDIINTCMKCSKVLSCKRSLNEHLNICKGVSSLQCPTCRKVFSSAPGKYQHIKNVKCSRPQDLPETMYEANERLNLESKSQRDIIETQKSTIETQKNKIETQNNNDGVGENSDVQNNDVVNKCMKCSKVLSSKKSLNRHINICKGVSSLQCPTCRKAFTSTSGKWHHIKNVKCSRPQDLPETMYESNERLNLESKSQTDLIKSLKNTIETQKNKIETNENTIETHKTTIKTQSKHITTQKNTIETQKNTSETHRNKIETHRNTIETHENTIKTHVKHTKTHKNTIETNNNTIDYLINNINIKGLNGKTIEEFLKGKQKIKRGALNESIKKQIASDQKWTCSACNSLLVSTFQIDHTIPLWNNGPDCKENATAMCVECHAKKTQDEWIQRAK